MIGTFKIVRNCKICQSEELDSILFLGNYFPPNSESSAHKLPLSVDLCGYCATVQIAERFPREINFPPEYPFRSGITRALNENFLELADELVNLLPQGAKILEIGSNDGTLLRLLYEKNFKVSGVEPTMAAMECAPELTVSNNFFEDVQINETFDCIVLTNTFAHLDDQVLALEKITKILKPNGLVMIEVVDLDQLLDLHEFDKFTHEHSVYFNQQSLENLMNSRGYLLMSSKKISTHGGSLRACFKYNGKLARIDQKSGLEVIERFKNLRQNMDYLKSNLHDAIKKLERPETEIFLAGATNRGEILIHALEVDIRHFIAVLDHAKSKRIGSRMRNLELQVVSDQVLAESKFPVVLILAWHVHNEIIESLRNLNPETKFIVPLPTVKIL